ncbi:MAG: EF-P 5-aminopentanol modification-associated protein YfmF [Clostridia bacterium]
MPFNTIEVEEGIKFHKINTNKFKTNLLAVYLTTKLNRENITKNALILSILKRGTKNLTTQEAINIKLEELYGAEFNCGIDKLGNDSVLKFYIESLNDNFTYQKENVLEGSINTLFEIIFNPLVKERKFDEEYFRSEKENLRQIIRARKDDKARYAYTRCIEEMYKDEPYGLYTYGYEEDLDKITNEDLYETYLKILQDCKIDIFISGDFSENSEIDTIVINNIKQRKLKPRKIEDLYIKNESKKPIKEKVIKEKMDVSQGKLVIGLDVIDTNKEEKPITSVYNAILGGGANSKLFQNVREKASLAYSAGSIYIKNKDNIIIKSGIESVNYEKAVNIIKQQIEDMKNGEFSQKDIENAKQLIIASFKSMQDEQDSSISYYFGKEMEQERIDIETYIKQIESVTKEQITNLANKIAVNTIYFLSK